MSANRDDWNIFVQQFKDSIADFQLSSVDGHVLGIKRVEVNSFQFISDLK